MFGRVLGWNAIGRDVGEFGIHAPKLEVMIDTNKLEARTKAPFFANNGPWTYRVALALPVPVHVRKVSASVPQRHAGSLVITVSVARHARVFLGYLAFPNECWNGISGLLISPLP